MRKIVAGFASSVDGYIAGIHDEYDWIIIDEKIDFGEEMKRFDAFFYGRRSYEMAKSMASKPAAGTTNYVFSTTLEDVHPDFVLLKGNVKEVVSAMKQQPGKDMAVFGGANLLASLLNMQLVDEISVSFIPVLLGSGKSMVDFLTKKVWLEFISSKRYGNGTLVVKYAVNYGG